MQSPQGFRSSHYWAVSRDIDALNYNQLLLTPFSVSACTFYTHYESDKCWSFLDEAELVRTCWDMPT